MYTWFNQLNAGVIGQLDNWSEGLKSYKATCSLEKLGSLQNMALLPTKAAPVTSQNIIHNMVNILSPPIHARAIPFQIDDSNCYGQLSFNFDEY
jgi:hypothetical protein